MTRRLITLHEARLMKEPPGLDVVCMADVKPSSINWLWQNWIALGKVSVLAGDGGRGKSTILCDLTARATTGSVLARRWGTVRAC
jgi:putative DNA primase/helicase